MDFDLGLQCDSFVYKEFSDSFSMISLQLNNLTPSFVVNDGTIATPQFLEMSYDLFEIELFW